jgi:hypothetical protein
MSVCQANHFADNWQRSTASVDVMFAADSDASTIPNTDCDALLLLLLVVVVVVVVLL